MSNLVIALKNYDPNPLFHVSTRGSFSSKPSVTLHSGSNEGTPSLATADLQSFSSSIQIVLYPRNTGSGSESGGANWNRNGKEEGKEPIQEKLKSEGAFTNAFSFNFEILGSGKGKRGLSGRLARVQTFVVSKVGRGERSWCALVQTKL